MTGEFSIAVNAIVYLNHVRQTVSSDLLAGNVCTNPARIRKVMSKLKRAKLIETKEGAIGGYRFALDAKEVTLLHVLDALDQPLVAIGWRSGNPELECLIASGMADIMDHIYGQMNDCCREKLSNVSIQDVEERIFREN
ncbi:MAG: Rrf2 family transcriptional regulator [Clostridia bacterium]